MKKKCWVIAPFDFGEYPEQWERVWQYDLDNGVISVGWGTMGDVTGMTLEQVREKFDAAHFDAKRRSGAHAVYNLFNEIKPGHRIIARRGTKQIAGVGTVKGRAYFDRRNHREPYEGHAHFSHIDVKWDAAPRGVRLINHVFGIGTIQAIAEDKFDELIGSVEIDVETAELTDAEREKVIQEGRLRIGCVETDNPEMLARRRKGQDRLKRLTVRYYGGRCAVCDVEDERLLIASHVVGWAAAPKHRGRLENVICLCRIHDALFEAGYWSLSDELELLKKKSVESKTISDLLVAMTEFRRPSEFRPLGQFLKKHRKRCGFIS